jgi:hypothetical protein
MSYQFASAFDGAMIRQPFRATCAKCNLPVYFDIDPGGTPGFNGDWRTEDGDYGCVLVGDDDAHVPLCIAYDRTMYPRPEEVKA